MRNFIRFFGFVLVLVLTAYQTSVRGQCALDVSVEISDTTTTTLLVVVENLVNNDLSGPQDLCGVELRFRHSYVGDLTIELVSPSGQSVQLVGAVTDQISPTNLTTWNVRFVPCGFPTAPDAGFSAQWSNNQPWQVFTTYTGTYHPFSGCLENFNVGSANGIWQLVLTDHDPPQTGELLGITLIFCDNTGLECNFCGADAGRFVTGSFDICEGASIPVVTSYADTVPDPLLYNFTYLVEDQTGTYTEQDAVNTASMSPGSYTICAMSYDVGDSTGLFQQLAPLNLAQIQAAFAAGNIAYCADLSENCVTLNISPAIDTVFQNRQICGGETVTIGGRTFSTTGTHVVNVDVPGSCDSVYVLELNVILVTARVVQQDTISCTDPMTILDGSSTTAGPGASYQWSTLNGTIVGPANQPVIMTDGAGNYTLTVSWMGCIDQLTYTVIGDGSIPFISVRGGTLSCNNPTYTFNTVVFPTNVNIQWNGPMGFSSNQLRPTVGIPGTYFLLITDPDSCAASVAVNVLIDTATIKPQIVATVDCANQRTFLSGTPGNLDHIYSWTGPNGFTSPFRQFWATMPGTYCATLTLSNGCSRTTCIDVQNDYTIPDIDISATSDTLNCGAQIGLTASSMTPGVAWSWSGPAGVFSSSPVVNVISSGTYIATVLAPNGCSNRDTSVIINGPDIFDALVFGDTLNCLIDTGLIGAVTFEPGATYSWSGPGVVDPLEAFTRVTAPGIYQVSVTAGTCTRILNVAVVADFAIPNFTLFGDTITCNDPIAELSMLISSPFNEILWQLPDGSTSPDSVLQSLLPGQYILTIARANGCSLTKIVQVPADTARPIVFLESDLLGCDSTQIRVIPADSIVSYDWSGPSGYTSQLAMPYVHEGGFYLLDATGLNGCVRSSVHFVDTNLMAPQVMITQEQLDCLDSMAQLVITSADTGVTYTWYANGMLVSDSSLLVVNEPGIYLSIARGVNGCERMDSVEVLPPVIPQIMATTDTITCLNAAMLQSGSDLPGVVFNWEDSAGNMGSGPLFMTSNAGPAIVTATWTNGCSRDTVVIVEIDTMPPMAIAQNNEMVLCDLQTINLDASASAGQLLSFLWSTVNGIIDSGRMLATPTITGEGTYIVTVTDGTNGCTDTDSITVVEGQSVLSGMVLTVISECEGNENGSISVDSVTGAATSLTYELDGLPGGPLFQGLSVGEYLITSIDSFGCRVDSLVEITNTSSMSSVSLGEDRVITLGDSTLLIAGINLDLNQLMSVRWIQNVGCDTCLTNVVKPQRTTEFEIEIEDIFGCIARDAVLVIVEERAKFYIPNIFSPNGDNINDRLGVFTHPGVERVLTFSIFDRWGDVVFHETDFDGSVGSVAWDGTAEGKEVNPGVFVYLLELKLLTGRIEILTGTLTLIK